MWLILTLTDRSHDTAHVQWPVGSIILKQRDLSIVTQEQIVIGCSKLVEVRTHDRKFITAAQGQKVNC